MKSSYCSSVSASCRWRMRSTSSSVRSVAWLVTGGRYDYNKNELNAADPIPEFLHPLRQRDAELGQAARRRISPTRSSLNMPRACNWAASETCRTLERSRRRSVAAQRLPHGVRGYPPGRAKSLAVEFRPRSVYRMQGEARWGLAAQRAAGCRRRDIRSTFRALRTSPVRLSPGF